MTTHSAGAATPALEVPSYELRIDQVLESKHKFVSSRPGIVEFEHAGRRLRLVLPIDCPACDFLVTVAAADWLFLIGRQRAPQDASSGGGALVIARRCAHDLYVTELWHETYGSFLWRSGLEPAPWRTRKSRSDRDPGHQPGDDAGPVRGSSTPGSSAPSR
jgi:hypothetical protein